MSHLLRLFSRVLSVWMMSAQLLLCVFSYLLVSCSSEPNRRLLSDAEQLMSDRPDSAFAILERVDTATFFSRRVRSRYDLLYATALDKNNVDDGSFLRQASELNRWAERFGSRRQRMLSEYYYADQLADANNLEEAAVVLMRAEQNAIRQKDWFYAGMANRRLHHIFNATYNHPEAIKSIEKAIGYFHRVDKEQYENYALQNLASSFYNSFEFDKADSVYRVLISNAKASGDTLLWSRSEAKSAAVYLVDGHYNADSALLRINRAVSLKYRLWSRDVACLALAEALSGNQTCSDKLLNEAYALAEDNQELMTVTYRDYQVRSLYGDVDSSLSLLRKLVAYSDSVSNHALQQSVVRAQNTYLTARNEQLAKEKRTSWTIVTLQVLSFILLLSLALFALKKKRERRQIEERTRQIELDSYRVACQELGMLGFSSLDMISKAYYSSGNARERMMLDAYKTVIDRFRSDKDFLSSFFHKIDLTHNKVISKLREQLPALYEGQVLLFSFLVAGFSYTTISVIMNNKPRQYLYDRRQHLIRYIQENNPQDKELFLSYLPGRSTRL